jgi:hypothetical protein
MNPRDEHIAEISATRRVLQSVRFRVGAVVAVLGPMVRYLMTKFVDTEIGRLAMAAWEKITALLAPCSKFRNPATG